MFPYRSFFVAFALALLTVIVGFAESPFGVDDMLDVVDVSIADVSKDGRWVAVTATTLRDRIGVDNYRYGDPSYVAPRLSEVWIIDTRTGEQHSLFPSKRQVTGFRWDPEGKRLAFLIQENVGFDATIWDRIEGHFDTIPLPPGRVPDEQPELRWSPDGGKLFLTSRSSGWSENVRKRFAELTETNVIVLSSENPILAWEDLRRLGRLRSLVVYDVGSGQTQEILTERYLSSYDLSSDGSSLVFSEDMTEKTDYDVIFGSDNRVSLLPTAGGEPRVLIKTVKGNYSGPRLTWSRQHRHYAYAEKGKIYFGSIDDEKPHQLTGKTDEEEEKDEPEVEEKEGTLSPTSVSPFGKWVIANNNKGFWLVDTENGAQELVIETPEDEVSPRYEVLNWDPKGNSFYLIYRSQTEWDRGVARFDLESRRLDIFHKDEKLYRDFALSRDGATWVFRSSEGNRPYDVFTADAEFHAVRGLTTANPRLSRENLARTELISYLDVDGKRLYGVLYYPLDYVKGKQYPTVFNIYEKFFDDTYNGTINLLTANGYAVVRPSVEFETGYPGEAWMKGVTAAANKVIEMGVADRDRLGVHGTSYGGYATNLLITQTHRFKAAINISGKVNMVSFYTDSPRLGVRNTHAPEKSQDRIGATLWEQPQKYIQHSAVMFADRIETPLLLIAGDQDHNVPGRQAMEMYYALRRLGKDVTWVNYLNGGHGMPRSTVEEVADYHRRILDWYEKYLREDDPKTES